MSLIKPLFVAALCVCLGACFNDNHEREVHLGSVSIGQQLVDLKAAREAGAISKAEYRQARAALLQLISELACKGEDCEDVLESLAENDEEISETDEDEEGFSWL